MFLLQLLPVYSFLDPLLQLLLFASFPPAQWMPRNPRRVRAFCSALFALLMLFPWAVSTHPTCFTRHWVQGLLDQLSHGFPLDLRRVSDCTSQGSPERQKQKDIGGWIYKSRFILGIDLWSYGGREVPQPAIWKLQNQVSQRWNSFPAWRPEDQVGLVVPVPIWFWKPENQEHQWARAGEDGCFSSSREWIYPLSVFLLYVDAQCEAHSHWGGPSALLSSPTQMPVSSGSMLSDTPRNNVLPALWASLFPV